MSETKSRRLSSGMRIALLALALIAPHAADAQTLGIETGLELPRFESLRFDEVRMRVGPGTDYPIRFLYRRKGLPIQVIREYRDWREVRDHEGATGWIKRTQLSARRTAFVTAETAMLYRFADPDSRALVRVSRSIVLDLERCEAQWCRVEVSGYRGWIARESIWGATATEEPGES